MTLLQAKSTRVVQIDPNAVLGSAYRNTTSNNALKFQQEVFNEYLCLPRYYAVKVILEYILALSLFLFLLAPMLIIALLVRVKIGSPIIYKHLRVGQFGNNFYVYKFRTMKNNVPNVIEMGHGPLDKIKSDPRVVGKFGIFLRKYKWDELPQLWNILRGEMCLIGPRPYPLEENFAMEGKTTRFCVKPGISGRWQVEERHISDPLERESLDVDYVRNLSLQNDLKIFIRTITILIRGER